MSEAEKLIASTSLTEFKDHVPDSPLRLVEGFKVVNHKTLGQLGRFQAVSDTEMIVVNTVALENGWVVVCQEGTETKRSIIDPNDQRLLYEDTQGSVESIGKFAMSKMVGKDGSTANFSTGRSPGGPTYPSTESESYYFSADLRESSENVVGVSIARNDNEEFIDAYEGSFSASIHEKIHLSGQEGYVATLDRNGFGLRTIKYANTFWWYKGEFDDGSPNGYGIACDNKHGERSVHYVNGSIVTSQSR